ncbi:MAG: hypothetical protein LBE08_02280 [Bifidobacteriaceae bacterium]|jgi:hypothetical protein|nr:hypothetical protein [Bifidobacteriaceae bacterium]
MALVDPLDAFAHGASLSDLKRLCHLRTLKEAEAELRASVVAAQAARDADARARDADLERLHSAMLELGAGGDPSAVLAALKVRDARSRVQSAGGGISVAAAVPAGREAVLGALRARLAAAVDACESPRDLPALARRLQQVDADLDALGRRAVTRGGGGVDELAQRRAQRQSRTDQAGRAARGG